MTRPTPGVRPRCPRPRPLFLKSGQRSNRAGTTRREAEHAGVMEPTSRVAGDDPALPETLALLRSESRTEPRLPGRAEEDARAAASSTDPYRRAPAERHRALADAPGAHHPGHARGA